MNRGGAVPGSASRTPLDLMNLKLAPTMLDPCHQLHFLRALKLADGLPFQRRKSEGAMKMGQNGTRLVVVPGRRRFTSPKPNPEKRVSAHLFPQLRRYFHRTHQNCRSYTEAGLLPEEAIDVVEILREERRSTRRILEIGYMSSVRTLVSYLDTNTTTNTK